jgi:hypothetical protein
MSLLAQLPEHSLFSAPTRANSQAVDPNNITVTPLYHSEA